jgi:hypothetical protein
MLLTGSLAFGSAGLLKKKNWQALV